MEQDLVTQQEQAFHQAKELLDKLDINDAVTLFQEYFYCQEVEVIRLLDRDQVVKFFSNFVKDYLSDYLR